MTGRQALQYADAIMENTFKQEIKLIWLNQIEAEIQVDVLLMAAEGITQYDETSYGAELIAPAPFDQLYQEYLFWRICLAQQETEKANSYAATFNRIYNEYVRFVCETINPGNGLAERVRYYLTAYQLAVKHGFVGTELDWLRSLKGAEGKPGAGLNIVGQVASEAELPKSGMEAGIGYLVGYGINALLYIWNGSEWFYKTQLSGKGETGPAGIYYGTEEPTDPSHPIWVNPEGEPTTGLVFSNTILKIETMSRAEYNALPTPRPSTTAYLIKG